MIFVDAFFIIESVCLYYFASLCFSRISHHAFSKACEMKFYRGSIGGVLHGVKENLVANHRRVSSISHYFAGSATRTGRKFDLECLRFNF